MEIKALSTDPKMTVREVSEIIQKDPRTVQLKVKELFPELVVNGKTTYLNESQVTAVKLDLEKRFEVKTDLEKKMIVQQAMMILNEEIEQLRTENLIMKPKVELAEKALRDQSKHYCIRDAGKHLGLNQTAIFKIFHSEGLLTIKNIPTQKALDWDLLTLRTNVVGNKNYPQSVMTMQNIDNFRKRYLI